MTACPQIPEARYWLVKMLGITKCVLHGHTPTQEGLICRQKTQPDATQWFIELIMRLTCFGHYYAHHQEPQTIQVITASGTYFVLVGCGVVSGVLSCVGCSNEVFTMYSVCVMCHML